MISIICVYNNKKILDKYLLKSLKSQIIEDYELILLDNTQKKFKSASEALNYGGKKAKGEYILFAHQDIDLISDTFLIDLEAFLIHLQDLGIAGVAGKVGDKKEVITRIKQGNPPKNVSTHPIKKITKVQTIDECLFLIPKTVFNEIKFDEEVCDGWHLYGVDYSLNIISHGLDVYVIPISVYHKSIGYSFSKEYYVTVEKLLKKYDFDKIYTTMGTWDANKSLVLQKIKQKIDWKLSLIKEFLS